MHAADVVTELPVVRLDDELLSAVRIVSRGGLPGLAVADEQGRLVAGISAVELLRLIMPRYLLNEPLLARVFDESQADRIAAALVDLPVRDVVDGIEAPIPVVRSEATVVEVAEMMAERGCPLVLVREKDGGILGIVTAQRLLDRMVVAAEGDS